jgi:hypothetical protein
MSASGRGSAGYFRGVAAFSTSRPIVSRYRLSALRPAFVILARASGLRLTKLLSISM